MRSGVLVRTFERAINLPTMEKLKGRENYASWMFSMKMALIREVKPLEVVD